MNRSAASLIGRALGVGISTEFLSALLLVTSAPTAGAAGAAFTALTATMTVPRSGHTATLLPNGKVLLIGGDNLGPSTGTTYTTAELYDPVANTFTALTAALLTPREGHTATLLPNGQVLLTGGFNDHSSDLDTAELYDPVANTFTALAATMTTARTFHTATLLPNGKVLITGLGSDNDLDTAELYDPVANTFTALTATMTTARQGHTATLLPNGQVLLTGGTGVPPVTTEFNTAELYDPVANTFTAVTATMTTARLGHTATLLPNGQVLIVGGGYGSKSSPFILDTAELYDPVANTFTALTATMTIARTFYTATLLPNDQVFLTGGASGLSGPALNTAELYTSSPAATPTPTAGPTTCAGDCSGDGEVTVNEIITLVNIALGTQHVSGCPNGLPATATDADVTVAVIIQAVNHALTGCSG